MLAHGRPHLAIPGPSVTPDRVLRAMHRTSPDIYEGELIGLTESLLPSLRGVARTAHAATIYIGNGHAAWEAALVNTLSRGDRVLVPATGRFAHGWAGTAQALGIETQVIDFGDAAAMDPGRIEEALRADPDRRIRAVLAVHTDTATSVRSDLAAVRAAMDAAGHPALLMADCMASLGCDPFEMDAWGVDVTMAGSQKGLMTPPGLFFLWISPRARAAREGAGLVTPYWDWRPRADPEAFWHHFWGTPPVQHLYGLREALSMIEEEGIEAVWARHAALARAAWAAAEAWAMAGPLRLTVPDAAIRSHAVTSIGLGEGQGDRLRDWVRRTTGTTLGVGLGRDPASAYVRIGHMGHVGAHALLGTLACIDAGLKATGIPHGPGALDAAAAAIAEATRGPAP